jgi:hypothetical protein
MTDEEYIKKIEAIPHLNLTPFLKEVPLDNIKLELESNLQSISKFDYSRVVDSRRKKFLEEIWQGFSLVDITKIGSHMIDYYTTDLTHTKVIELGAEIGDDGFAKFFITDIGNKMPITTEYTTSLFENLCRIRVSKLKASSSIKYHCHLAKAKSNPKKIVPDECYRATLHIPLITSDNAYFAVTKDIGFAGHPDDFHISNNEIEYKQKYSLGEVWMFNSVHYHTAVNNDNKDRYHILIYFDFMDPKIRPIIERAIESYTGPFIE